MDASRIREIVRELEGLADDLQQDVLEYVRELKAARPTVPLLVRSGSGRLSSATLCHEPSLAGR